MGLLRTLLRPDSEEAEAADRSICLSAANLLQVGEFQFLQLAYRQWFAEDMPDALTGRLFAAYMLRDTVPAWARHYARTILQQAETGRLDPDDPAYHRYDHDYHTAVPQGLRRFLVAAAVLVVAILGAIVAASLAARPSLSLLPPYFERDAAPAEDR